MKKNILKNNGVQSLLASLLCIVLGLFLLFVIRFLPKGIGSLWSKGSIK